MLLKTFIMAAAAAVVLAGCGESGRKGRADSAAAGQAGRSFFDSDSVWVGGHYQSENEHDGTCREFRGVNYETLYAFDREYISKWITTTKECSNLEGRQRKFRIELYSPSDPKSPVRVMEHECDYIDYPSPIRGTLYRTVQEGCCGAEDEFEVYGYDLELVMKYNKIDIAKTYKDIYIQAGYKPPATHDSFLGTLYVSFYVARHPVERADYVIRIKYPEVEMNKSDCADWSPAVIIMHDGDDRRRMHPWTGEFVLLTLNEAENIQQLNDVTIRLNYGEDGCGVLDIPIINGMPFGKSAKAQETAIAKWKHMEEGFGKNAGDSEEQEVW